MESYDKSFKLGECPWQNYFCEYIVFLSWFDLVKNEWTEKYYCKLGSYRKEETCPIELEKDITFPHVEEK